MPFRSQPEAQADEFIRVAIDSVPHLEALLLFWTARPRACSADDVAGKLYIDPARARDILDSLLRRGLLEADDQPGCVRYAAQAPEQDALMATVEHAYKTDLIRITRMIHSKAAPAVRDFAQAFRLKKD